MWPLVLVALAATQPALSGALEDPWRTEGSFGTDTLLPFDVELERLLASGDEALEDEDADLSEVFAAWEEALEDAERGAWVRWDTRVHWERVEEAPSLWSERRAEGLSSALLIRLADEELRAAWVQHVSADSEADLTAALNLPVERAALPLAALSARYPGTSVSARAALWCSDHERARGRTRHAEAWLARAEECAALLGDPALTAAIQARAVDAAPSTPEAWELADAWEAVDFALLTDDLGSPASGLRGLARWGAEEIFIQSAELAWTLGPRRSARVLSLRDVADRAGQPLARNWMRPGSKWRHQPTTDEGVAYCVLGRARSERSNVLVAFSLVEGEPSPRWSLGPGGWRDSDGALRSALEDALGPGVWEFQPGPLVVDDLLIVQARRWELSDSSGRLSMVDPARAEAAALALELSSGSLVWRTTLARGSEHFGDAGLRFRAAETPSRAAPSPLLCGSSLVFATGLGACVALDLADGRAQRAVLGQRIEGNETPSRAPVAKGSDRALWIPLGGERAYELALGARHPELRRSPFTSPPRRATGWSSMVGARGGRLLVAVTRRGRHQLELTAEGELRPQRSVQLSPGEALAGAHALGASRLLSASDQGLFVFDLDRELYLVGHVPLDPSVTCLRDGLLAAGSWVFALTDAGVYRIGIAGR